MLQLVELLEGQPSYDELCVALQDWTRDPIISKPKLENYAVTRVLVTETVPSFWPVAQEGDRLQSLLKKSLASIEALEILLAHCHKPYNLGILQMILESDELQPWSIYVALAKDLNKTFGDEQTKIVMWSQYVNLLAGGRLLGTVSQTILRFKLGPEVLRDVWLHDTTSFSCFLAQGVLRTIQQQKSSDERLVSYLSMFLTRSMSLGPSSPFVITLISGIVSNEPQLMTLVTLLESSQSIQSRFVRDMLDHLQSEYLFHPTSRISLKGFQSDADRVGAVAYFLGHFVNGLLMQHLELSFTSRASSYNLALRRALVVAFPTRARQDLMKKCLETWANPTFIKLTSVLDQEALTESILLLGASLDIGSLAMINRGPMIGDGVSNHLESTSDRIRFLGMIVGEAVTSRVIQDEKKRMIFDVPETRTAEANWWRSLIEIEDKMTGLEYLRAGLVELPDDLNVITAEPANEIDVSELLEDDLIESSDDEEFQAMRVPDSDDEDSDDDPSLVDREKLRPPVYVRDLIKMLNNHESYKHVSMALRTAPTLIRRKQGFGTEVEDYAINLVQLFAGLRDNFDMENFQELRQNALRALVVVCPKTVCPYLTETFFTGDYSLQQRVIILSAIGLGSRELAGALETAPEFKNLTISKPLPLALRQQLDSVTSIATTIQGELLQPLAMEAAETLSGPAALKVHRNTRRVTRPTPRKVDNRLTTIVAEYILYPLLGRFQLHAGKMIEANASAFYEANLLAYYLRTVSLVLQVSSQSTALNRLTAEYWDLLLSLRTQTDHQVLSALLFGFLILIDTNDSRRLATDCAGKLIETSDYCEMIFNAVTEDKVRQVAAGVMLKIREIIEQYQLLMMTNSLSIGNIGRGRLGLAGLK